MKCSACGAENPAEQKFCNECAAPFKKRCSKCGYENPPAAKFCGDCATALSSSSLSQPLVRNSSTPSVQILPEETVTDSAALEGERKTVTALFADIKGSTALMEGLDPEAAHAIVEPVLRLMIEAMHRYEGYVVRSTGDGIFALFGAPVAHEDHPQRALYAALRLQEELKRYAARLREAGELPIEARVGVNTGEVVAYTVETDGKVEYRLVGHTANLAARMEALAPTGSIAISDDTRRLVEGYFQLKPLGPTRVQGVSAPVNVYEVTGLGPLRTRLQRSEGRGLTKFVGRQREMETLKHAAELARQGHAQIVAAMAEPGVGKSRLFFEFEATSRAGWMVLETVSVSHGKASAYLPVIDLLRNYFRIASEDDERTRREKVTGRVLALDRNLEDTLPYLFSLLGIVEGEDPLAQMDGPIKKRRTLEAIKRILLRESLNQPLMVIFEDLHWIDEQTQELLDLLADSIGTAKILLLVNYRPEYSHHWGSKTFYTQLRLDPLGKESAEELLSALLGEGKDLTPLKRLIIERTEGTPFFMEEIVQSFFEDGVLQRNGVVKLAKSMNAVRVPTTVQAMLAARIDRLPADEKELLQTLAVIGREFALSLVRRVVDRRKDDELERMLANLQVAEFIYEQPATGDIEYIFKHALTQEVAYNSILAERRRMIHERTARAIEAIYEGQLEDHYAEVAHHYLRGNNATKAVRYAALAAEQAVSRAAYAEATSLIETALKLLADRLPETAERLRSELALRTVESTLAFVLYGPASPERERAVGRMCELGEELGEPDQLLRGLINLRDVYLTRSDFVQGLELAKRCRELAETVQDAGLLADSGYGAGLMAQFCGNLPEAVSHLENAALYSSRTRRAFSNLGLLYGSSIPCLLASALQLLGRSGEAARVIEGGLRLARESGHLFSLGHALAFGGLVANHRRDAEAAQEFADEAIALCEENGFTLWLLMAQYLLGCAMAELGQTERGIADLEAANAGFARMGGRVPLQQALMAKLAHAYGKIGQPQKALTMLDEALAHGERTGVKLHQAEILRIRGELLLTCDSQEEAEHSFRMALEVARAQEARWWELRATTSLARMLAKQGNRGEARTILADIYGWFAEGFDLPDLKDAKAVLDELAA
jgi:class 3 adenylate cyclase/tetratricopeptide (TPR) repeat protein